MKREEFLQAMAYWAEAEDRSTALLIEMIAGAVLLKLNPPVHGADVAHVTISHAEMEELFLTHHVESQYEPDAMTVFVTPLGPRRAEAGD